MLNFSGPDVITMKLNFKRLPDDRSYQLVLPASLSGKAVLEAFLVVCFCDSCAYPIKCVSFPHCTGWSEKNGCFSQSNNYFNIEGEIRFNLANYRGEHAVLRVLRLFHRSCFYCHVNTVQSQ